MKIVRQILPGPFLTMLFAGIAFTVILEIIGRLFAPITDEIQLQLAPNFFLGLIAFFYAIYRAFKFHPLGDTGLALWTAVSPYEGGGELPAGPVNLKLLDFAVIAVLSAVNAFVLGGSAASPITVFGIFYALSTMNLFTRSGMFAPTMFSGFYTGLFLIFAGNVYMSAILLIGFAILCRTAMKQSCAHGPRNWLDSSQSPDAPYEISHIYTPQQVSFYSEDTFYVGWPYAVLSPKPTIKKSKRRTAFAVSAVLGWLAFAIIWPLQKLGDENRLIAIATIVMALAVIYLLMLIARYRPRATGRRAPISFLGRFAIFRPIDWKYDRNFLTGLACLIIPIMLSICSVTAAYYGMPLSLSCGITVFISFWSVFGLGPSMYTWSLTTSARHVFPKSQEKFYTKA